MERDLEEEFLVFCLEKEKFAKKKIRIILGIDRKSFPSFKNFNFKDNTIFNSNGKKGYKLTENQMEKLKKIQDDIVISKDLRETMVKFIARTTLRTQYENLGSKTLGDLNINPFMVRLLQLRTPKDVVGYFTRSNFFISVATSLGHYFEYFLIFGHPNVYKLKKGFDARLVNGQTYYIELKSGLYDVNKTGMRQYNTDFKKKERTKAKPIMGFLYGNRTLGGVALTHANNELDKPDEWVKVGKETWEFVSGKQNYHNTVMRWMDDAVDDLNFSNKILDQVELTVSKLVKEFEKKFGKGKKGVQKCISKSM